MARLNVAEGSLPPVITSVWRQDYTCTAADTGTLRHPVQQHLRLPLHRQPRILLRLRPGYRRDPLHEVEDALGRAAFLGENGLDDPGALGAGEAAFA